VAAWDARNWLRLERPLDAKQPVSHPSISAASAPALLLRIEHNCSTIDEGRRVPPQSEGDREAKQTRLPLEVPNAAGSHGTVYLGKRLAVVKDLKKDLGIRKEDL
jgi:hypothetical protein